MRNNSNILCSSTLSCQSFSPLLFIRYPPPALCAPAEERKSAKVRVQAENWFPVGLFPILYIGSHSVARVVLWCDHSCVVFLLAAGLTSCPMETHQMSFLFCGQRARALSLLVPVETALIVWPLTFWNDCMSGKKKKTSLLLNHYYYLFSLEDQ